MVRFARVDDLRIQTPLSVHASLRSVCRKRRFATWELQEKTTGLHQKIPQPTKQAAELKVDVF
jgi:hypothetical protein